MAVDALDPGPNGDYPYWPRNADGSTDRKRMPKGHRRQKVKVADDRGEVLIDITPRKPDGSEIIPPGTEGT